MFSIAMSYLTYFGSTLVSGATESSFCVFVFVFVYFVCLSSIYFCISIYLSPPAGKWGHSKPNLANTEDCSTEKMKSLNK